jgi:DNA-binding NtrC family response regulator
MAQKQVRLLVCDPDPQDKALIEGFLRDSSIAAFFTSPTESLESLLSKYSPFHAVVIDLSNPVKRSCSDMVAAVKRVAPSAQVIFMSRLADEMLWSQVLEMGAHDLLPKPPDRSEFLRSVFSAVRQVPAA